MIKPVLALCGREKVLPKVSHISLTHRVTLARHKLVTPAELLPLYDRASETVQPVLAVALALTKPGPKLAAAITGDSLLNRWTYEWAELFA